MFQKSKKGVPNFCSNVFFLGKSSPTLFSIQNTFPQTRTIKIWKQNFVCRLLKVVCFSSKIMFWQNSQKYVLYLLRHFPKLEKKLKELKEKLRQTYVAWTWRFGKSCRYNSSVKQWLFVAHEIAEAEGMQFHLKENPTHLASAEFWKVFKNIFLTKHL